MHRLPVLRHRTARQAWAKYRACRHPVEKIRWHLVWLLLRADEVRTPARAAATVGVSAITARDDQRVALFAALEKRPPDGGLWSGPKVARYVADRWGVAVRPQTGWRWLVGLGFTLQVPRPSHPRSADGPTRRRWGKTSAGG